MSLTPLGSVLCDKPFSEGWYRFVGDAGTKMPTKRVPAFRCGTDFPGWLDGAHRTVIFAVIIYHGYFSVSQWNTSRRYLTLQA